MKRALVLAIAACSRRDPITSCADDLRGVYEAGDERWMVLDHGATLEAYPLFPDGAGTEAESSPAAPAPSVPLEIAPRVIDLERDARGRTALAGTLRRRYMQRADGCEAHVPVHVTRCAGDTLELMLADPLPPLAFSPCRWPGSAPSRVVRWRRS